MSKQTPTEKAKGIFVRNKGMLRTGEALRLGIHPRTLYAMRDRGDLEEISRGLYRLASAPPLTNPDWVPIAVRIPKAIICLISTLSHYGLTSEVPHAIDIALPSHAQVPKIHGVPIRVFWFSEPAFSSGVGTEVIDGVTIRIYSVEKTITDCFKYRNRIGLDVCIEALKEYRRRSKRMNLGKLLEFAEIGRVGTVMRPYLESLL